MKVFLATLLLVSGFNPLRACDTVVTDETGTISSPNFPGDYPANLNVKWIIFSKTGTNIRLTFNSFVTETNADFVRIYDGPTFSSPLLLTHSGVTLPFLNPVTSSSNAMLIHMTSNGAWLQYAGFSATFDARGTVSSDQCGGLLFGTGSFESHPNQADPYDDDMECVWRLQSNNQFITLKFTEFDTENKGDYVEVFEGSDINGLLVAKLSGTYTENLPELVSNATNLFTVRFTSDDSTTFGGFRAEFS